MSLLAALEKAKENVARFKKAKCMVEWLMHRITNTEQLLKDSKRLAKEYAESAVRLEAQLDSYNKQYDGLKKYITDSEPTIADSSKAEEMAVKIAKLQKQIAELTAKMEADEKAEKEAHAGSTTKKA